MDLRSHNLRQLAAQIHDVLVIGGGINGAVSAAALSARGVKVALIDKGDFAGSTSSNSSNLAWGGIKYLESHEYLLVNELCKSRNLLMRSYPTTVREIRFLTTIQKGFRFPPSLVYLGALLYWAIGRFVTRAPRYLNPGMLARREPMINTANAAGGLEYSDCYLYNNDARFVFNFIRSSLDNGCVATNYVESRGASRDRDIWTVSARDTISGECFSIRARAIVNACGPLVDQHNELTAQHTRHRHLFSKGIHLVVDRITDSERVLAFFASDGRLFFVIPMGPKTCIGTTDTRVESPEVVVTDEDRQFVLDNVNKHLRFERPLTRADIIAERCGVRPLAVGDGDGAADWVKLSRKHAIDINDEDRHLSIFGGKLTDCLNVGDEVCDIIADFGITLPDPNRIWYGEPDGDTRENYLRQAAAMNLDSLDESTSPEALSERLWRRYGADALELLNAIRRDPASATTLIEPADYLRCEIELSARREMVVKLEDFLRRRSRIAQVVRPEDLIHTDGLKEACRIFFGDQGDARLQEYIDNSAHHPGNPGPDSYQY